MEDKRVKKGAYCIQKDGKLLTGLNVKKCNILKEQNNLCNKQRLQLM